MKPFFKIILKYYLKYLTKLALFIHKPVIIAITGSNNKHFYKEEIVKVLEDLHIKVRSNPKNFNTEIGLPLAILYLPSGYNSYKNWLPILRKSLSTLWQKNFPEYLVLELGSSNPGDMKYLLSIVKPQIVIITDITQRYLESFSDMNGLVAEYSALINQISSEGLLIGNCDNNRIKNLLDSARCHTIHFGRSENFEWNIAETERNTDGEKIIISKNGKKSEHLIDRFGLHHVSAFTAAQIIKDYVANKNK